VVSEGGVVVTESYQNKPEDRRPSPSGLTVHDVVLVSLMDVLQWVDAPRIINYLSLDIEGYEYETLKHFDFNVYTFLVMTVERPNSRLHRRLIENGYVYIFCIKEYGDYLLDCKSICECTTLHPAKHVPSGIDDIFITNNVLVH
jgi:hypothetical protein